MSQIYETDKLVEEYLLFHYASDEEVLPWAGGPKEALNFPVRTVKHFSGGRVARALDIGCAVGRSSLELSREADEVVGIDFSQAFVDVAEKVRCGDDIRYSRLEEASVKSEMQVSLPEGIKADAVSVSYTHLTLPTIYSV